MLEPSKKSSKSLRPGHAVGVLAVAVIAVVVAYVAFGWIVGLFAFLIKTIIVIAVIGGALYLVARYALRDKR